MPDLILTNEERNKFMNFLIQQVDAASITQRVNGFDPNINAQITAAKIVIRMLAGYIPGV